MVRASIVQVGSLPTAHPASGPVLESRTEDQLVERRVERSRTALAARGGQAHGATATVPVRASVAA